MHSKNKSVRLLALGAILSFLLSSGSACNALTPPASDDNDDLLLIGLLFVGVVSVLNNACNSVASPVADSARAPNAMNNRATIQGRILTAAGAPVVSAVVIARQSSTVFASTYSSVNRDGSFILAGVPAGGADYKIAIESIDSDFAGRVDTHIDCFQTPASFTDGWYTGSGGALSTSESSGSTVTVSSENTTVDVGTILLNQ